MMKNSMTTEIIKAEFAHAKAAELLLDGQVIVIPTDTVYGLAALSGSTAAEAGIYRVKKRPYDKPLIRLAGDWDTVHGLVPFMKPYERGFAARYWDTGKPLTVIFENGAAVRMVTSGFAGELLRLLKRAVVAPSANTSGRPAPLTAEEVFADIGGKIPLIVNGGTLTGSASTIVRLDGGRFELIRRGDTEVDETK